LRDESIQNLPDWLYRVIIVAPGGSNNRGNNLKWLKALAALFLGEAPLCSWRARFAKAGWLDGSFGAASGESTEKYLVDSTAAWRVLERPAESRLEKDLQWIPGGRHLLNSSPGSELPGNRADFVAVGPKGSDDSVGRSAGRHGPTVGQVP